MFRSYTLAGLALLILYGSAAGSTLAILPTPGSSTICCGVYTDATALFPLPTPDGTLFTQLISGSETLTFSSPFMRLSVPATWASWSSPPQSETSTPAVAWSNGQDGATLTLSAAVAIFGFELEPDDLTGAHTYTVSFLSGGESLGSIMLPVSGNAGALLFAGEVTGSTDPNLIDTVTISGDTDFAVANLRYGNVDAVPEPASLLLILAGSVFIAGRRRAARGMGK